MAKQPERGDIIIMRPPHDMEIRYIKRLIGLPGDKIQVRNDITYINDIAVERVEVEKYTSESGQNFTSLKKLLRME
jgi:signal peptidase I